MIKYVNGCDGFKKLSKYMTTAASNTSSLPVHPGQLISLCFLPCSTFHPVVAYFLKFLVKIICRHMTQYPTSYSQFSWYSQDEINFLG